MADDGIYSTTIPRTHLTGSGRNRIKVIVTSDGTKTSVLVPITRQKRSVQSFRPSSLKKLKGME